MGGELVDRFGIQDDLTPSAFLVARAGLLTGGGLIGDPIRGSMRLLGDLLTLSRKLGIADRAIDHRVVRAKLLTGRSHLILADGGRGRMGGKLIDGLNVHHNLALGTFLVAQSVLLAGGGLVDDPIRRGMSKHRDRIGFFVAADAYAHLNACFRTGCGLLNAPFPVLMLMSRGNTGGEQQHKGNEQNRII